MDPTRDSRGRPGGAHCGQVRVAGQPKARPLSHCGDAAGGGVCTGAQAAGGIPPPRGPPLAFRRTWTSMESRGCVHTAAYGQSVPAWRYPSAFVKRLSSSARTVTACAGNPRSASDSAQSQRRYAQLLDVAMFDPRPGGYTASVRQPLCDGSLLVDVHVGATARAKVERARLQRAGGQPTKKPCPAVLGMQTPRIRVRTSRIRVRTMRMTVRTGRAVRAYTAGYTSAARSMGSPRRCGTSGSSAAQDRSPAPIPT
jgi:hypothetical protein